MGLRWRFSLFGDAGNSHARPRARLPPLIAAHLGPASSYATHYFGMGYTVDRGESRAVALEVVKFEKLSNTDRKSTRLNSSHSQSSYAVFCLKKKTSSTQSSLFH